MTTTLRAPLVRQDRPSAASKGYYRPELDALRFIAFFFVFLSHTIPDGTDPRTAGLPTSVIAILDGFSKACAFGVTLFFTLSAFLISELLMRERTQTCTVRVGGFYIRRILRIWPLYFAGVAAGVLFFFLPGQPHSEVSAALWFAGFLGSWWIVLHKLPLHSPMTPLWSISVEEQFYLVIPWLMKVASRKQMIFVCMTILLLANVWLWHLATSLHSDTHIWFDPLFNFQFFAGGMLLSLLLRGRLPSTGAGTRLSLLALGSVCWLTSTLVFHVRFYAMPFPGSRDLLVGYQLVLLGAVLILVSALGLQARIVPPWTIYLGRISYGLYVIHAFVIETLKILQIGHRLTLGIQHHLLRLILSGAIDFTLAFLITVALASISYRHFESIFLKMKKKFTIIESQPELSTLRLEMKAGSNRWP